MTGEIQASLQEASSKVTAVVVEAEADRVAFAADIFGVEQPTVLTAPVETGHLARALEQFPERQPAEENK
jgi:hypothetical protein